MFVAKGTTISAQTLQLIGALGIKTVNWFPENIYNPAYRHWFLENYQNYNHFLTFIPGVVKEFQGKTATQFSYVPFAVDPTVFTLSGINPADIEKYSCDVCFAGAWFPDREEILQWVVETGVNLKIFGWSGWGKTKLRNYYHGPLTVPEMGKLFKLAKISLNINMKPVNSGANVRTFEIPAVGGFQISENQNDLAKLFSIGEEIETFNNREDLQEKIRFYLANKERRTAIVSAGHTRVLQDHTFAKRIGQILDIIGKE